MTASHYVVIDNEQFPVSEDDQDETRRHILDAVRAGGDFVALRRDAGSVVEVLVTAATAVHIVHIDQGDMDAVARDADDDAQRILGEDLQWWLDTH